MSPIELQPNNRLSLAGAFVLVFLIGDAAHSQLNLPAGPWCAIEIEGAAPPYDSPLQPCDVSTWTFNSNGTYEWFLHAPPFFVLDGVGTYRLDGNTLTVGGIIADTLFSETPGEAVISLESISNDRFRFPDEDGDRWTYERRSAPGAPDLIVTSGLFVEFTATRNQDEVPATLLTKDMCPDRPGTHTFAPDLRVEDRTELVITNTLIGLEFSMTLTRSGTQPTLVKVARFRVTRNGTRPIAGGAARINFFLQPGDCVRLTFAPENALFLLTGEVLTASLFLTKEPPPPPAIRRR